MWIQKYEKTFTILKERLTIVLVLTIPDPHDDFLVCIGDSLDGLDGVLSQNRKPIAYESRKLITHELNYATHNIELAVVDHELKIWRYYLLGNPLKHEIDHQSLKYLFTLLDLNVRKR